MSIIVLLFLVAFSSCELSTRAESAAPPAAAHAASKGVSTGTTLSMLLIIFISALCITAFCSIYIRYCSYEHQLTIPQTVRATRGLDQRVLATCPVMSYSSLKLRQFKLPQNAEPQCAVCLAEFAEADVLRLLPKCGHVFHPVCIDAWLAAHVTCPVCRGEVSVEIEGGTCARHVFDESSARGGQGVGDGKEKNFRLLLRSHSTGHSLEGLAVKLPEEVTKMIMEDSERESVMRMKRSASYDVVLQSGEGGESSNSKGKSKSNSNNNNNLWVLSPFVSRGSAILRLWGVREEKEWQGRTLFHCEV
ncbi:hypothetical protein VNO78_32794 [Psophocarpus tetragonolobus]|uniref:RING-type E3 ubiquitin transferase n=1 Tax=Psophocarpus tetragonolobus TaxID=3891 RepID=A0AAN9RP94_PSOTE